MIVLLRHGNTFAPGETPRMVGAHEDVPLVPSGIAQADEAARALRGLAVTRLLAGPLTRTRQFAERLALAPIEIDERLRELDYGAWAGLDDAMIIARYGEAALSGWRERGAWQEAFGEREAHARARLSACLDALPEGTSVLVSSNGLLRLCHPSGAPLGTGKAAVLERRTRAVVRWNVTPEEARAALV